MILEPGTQLGPYEIMAHLGAGGMGQVYKARHSRLDRTVALKVLPEELAADPERLERFEREARAASALDHPGIVTIHDIAEAQGLRFIAMQYVRGQTLTELLLDKSRPDLKDALSYAIQIADALSAAHKHGIVHRDLKPDNLMVGQDGRVRILDFGLAKKMDRPEATRLRTAAPSELTRDGRIMGTAPYMSPEQALGERTDHRSDIFSFGSVLYEMVTGRRPFDADNVPGLLVSIVHDEATRPSALVPGLPLQLEQVLERALRKDPNKRYQSMADVRVELEEVRAAVDSGSFVSAEQIPAKGRARSKRWAWGAAAVVLIAAVPVGMWLVNSRAEPLPPPSFPVPLTSMPGNELHPALSPDGRQVAFVWDGGDGAPPWHIYVMLTSGGTPLQLTEGESEHWRFRPTWAPDGSEIAYIRGRSEDPDWEIAAVPALGGPPRAITRTNGQWSLDWSPDGKWLALGDSDSLSTREAVYLHSIETGERRQLTFPDGRHDDRDAMISPDGRRIAFHRAPISTNAMGYIFVQELTDSVPVEVTHEDSIYTIRDVAWARDGQSVVFSNVLGIDSDPHLVRVPFNGSGEVRLREGEGARHLSIARHADVLVYSDRPPPDVGVWRVSGPTAETVSEPEPILDSRQHEDHAAYSPDGTRIAFVSERMGIYTIWVADADGSNPRQLTDIGGSMPRWSPDGSQILFSGECGGACLIDASGGLPRNALAGVDHVGVSFPGWSVDGQWIYFQSHHESDDLRVWKYPTAGGPPVRLTSMRSGLARGGQDGWVYIFGEGGAWRVPHEGGEPEMVSRMSNLSWDVWRNYLVYADWDHPDGPAIWTLDLESQQRRRVAPIDGAEPLFGRVSVSSDGRWVLYTRADPSVDADLMRVDNFR